MKTSQRLQQLKLASDIIIQGHTIRQGDVNLKVYTVMGVHDDLQVRTSSYLLLSQLFNFICFCVLFFYCLLFFLL